MRESPLCRRLKTQLRGHLQVVRVKLGSTANLDFRRKCEDREREGGGGGGEREREKERERDATQTCKC
jgi:hypothetical protein